MKNQFNIAALSVATTFGIGFSQTAHAQEVDVRNTTANRFVFEGHPPAVDHVVQRQRYVSAMPGSTVKSGSAPKGLLGLPQFVGAAAPQVVAAAPALISHHKVDAKLSNSSPWSAAFGHPGAIPLVASAPATPPPPPPHQASISSPQISKSRAQSTTSTHTAAAVKKPENQPVLVSNAKPASKIESYGGKFYGQGAVLPGLSGAESRVDATVSAVRIPHR